MGRRIWSWQWELGVLTCSITVIHLFGLESPVQIPSHFLHAPVPHASVAGGDCHARELNSTSTTQSLAKDQNIPLF